MNWMQECDLMEVREMLASILYMEKNSQKAHFDPACESILI